jgi:hypothetical protein
MTITVTMMLLLVMGCQFKETEQLAGNALVIVLRGLATNWNQLVGHTEKWL